MSLCSSSCTSNPEPTHLLLYLFPYISRKSLPSPSVSSHPFPSPLSSSFSWILTPSPSISLPLLSPSSVPLFCSRKTPLSPPLSCPLCLMSFSFSFLSPLFVSCLSPPRGPHPGPEEPGLQRDTLSAAEGGAGQDKEEAAGQRRPLHLGDGRGQVHAAVLPHRLLALLWEAQWRLVMGAETIINDQ